MATRAYFRQSPVGIEETAALNANDTYKVDMGPTLGIVLLKGSQTTEPFVERAGPLPVGLLGTNVTQPTT